MRTILVLSSIIIVSIAFFTNTQSRPSFNGTAPGCGGGGCHNEQSGIVTAEVLDNLQVRITLSGTSSDVAGELVDASGAVVAINNSTGSNPFILTAPSAGSYTVNAGFANPSIDWGTTTVDVTVSGIDEKLIGSNPSNFELYSNYPNPFNPSTKIRYAISKTAFTTLKVYSILGQEIATLINEEKAPGVYEVNFDGLKLSSGTYVYKLQAGNFIETKKMILLK